MFTRAKRSLHKLWPHDVKKYLYDIQQAIELIETFLKDKIYEHFTKKPIL